jgi:hypothetical protein
MKSNVLAPLKLDEDIHPGGSIRALAVRGHRKFDNDLQIN